jgi:hypothetical protein
MPLKQPLRFDFLIFLFLVSISCLAQPAISYDKSIKRYGIKDKKTNAWLSQPVFNKIEKIVLVYGKPGYFLATKGSRQVFINSKGTATISPYFESVKESINNSKMFLVHQDDHYSFFKPGEGFMETPGTFESFEVIGSIY